MTRITGVISAVRNGLSVMAFTLAASTQVSAELPSIKIGHGALVLPSVVPTPATDNHECDIQVDPTASTLKCIAPEIKALARALKYDPDLIYQYVHDTISITPLYGMQKGALGAYIDGYGTAFDQAQLMYELLVVSAENNTTLWNPSVVVGTLTLNMAEATAWLGLSSESELSDLLGYGGIPATVSGGSVTLRHAWVNLTTDNGELTYNPAYKSHIHHTGINVANDSGYVRDNLQTSQIGAIFGVSSRQNVNVVTIESQLGTYSSALFSKLSGSYKNMSANEIIGGSDIVNAEKVGGAWQMIGTLSGETYQAGVPNEYRTKLSITLEKSDGINILAQVSRALYVDEIYGRKLEIVPEMTKCDFRSPQNFGVGCTKTTTKVTLKLDEKTVSQKSSSAAVEVEADYMYASGREHDWYLTLDVDHPYPADGGDYMDHVVTKPFNVVTTANILNGWGYTSGELMEKWAREYGDDKQFGIQINDGCDGCDSLTSIVSAQDNTKAKVGATWLAQVSRMADITARIRDGRALLHHSVGVSYSEIIVDQTEPFEGAGGYYQYPVDQMLKLDVSTGLSVVGSTGSVTEENALAHAIAAAASTLEGSVYEQILDTVDVASTAERFAWAEKNISGPVYDGGAQYVQLTAANVAQVDNLFLREGYSAGDRSPAACGVLPDYLCGVVGDLNNTGRDAVRNYLNDGYEVYAVNDEFLGPGFHLGPRVDGILKVWGETVHYHLNKFSRQRGAAFIAVKKSGSTIVDIAHVVTSVDGVYKGGAGASASSHDLEFDPAKAADILKDEYEDRSVVHGVDLAGGNASWSSGAILSVGNGGFPYELSYSLSFVNNQPRSGANQHWRYNNMDDNLRSEASISGSGLEAMGASNPENMAGTLVALYAAADLATVGDLGSIITVPFVNNWWSGQLSHNVVTLSGAGGGAQFVRRPDGSFNSPKGSAATLTQSGARCAVRSNRDGTEPVIGTCPTGTVAPVNEDYASFYRHWSYGNVGFTLLTDSHEQLTFEAQPYRGAGVLDKFSAIAHKHLLTEWKNSSGFKVAYDYEAGPLQSGIRLKSVENDFGRQLSLNYATTGGVPASADDGLGNTVTFDSFNGRQGFKVTGGGVYTFAAATLPPNARPRAGVMLGEVYGPTDTNNATLIYAYDEDLRIVAVKDALAVLGQRDAYNFHIAPGFRGERIDPLNNSYVALYGGLDSAGQRFGTVNDELGNVVRTDYDGIGRVLAREYPDGNRAEFAYDQWNNVVGVTKHPKDGSSSLSASTVYGGTRCSGGGSVAGGLKKPSSVTDFRGKTTTLCYTANGQVARATQPAVNGVSAVHEYAYNGVGQVVRSVSPEGIVTVNDYDGMGNLVKTVSNCGNASAVATSQCLTSNPEERPVTSYEYDAVGNMVQVNGPYEPAPGEADDVVTTFYDTVRRPVYQVAGDINPGTSRGNIVSAIKGAKVGTYTHTAYDALGRPTGVTTYGYNYKNNGNAIPLPPSWVNSAYMVDGVPCSGSGKVCVTTTSGGGRSDYRYDALDRVEYVEAFVDGNISRNRTTRTEYDPVGRVRKVWQGWGSADEIRYQEYGYTPNGQVDWVADANGNKTLYQYDGFDRLERTYFPDEGRTPNPSTMGSHNPNDFEEYHYDGNGNIVAKRTRKGDWIKSEYDALNRLDLKKVYQGGSWSGSMVSGGSLEASVDYSYLLDGRDDVITQIPGSGGTTIPYLSLNYGYDSAGRQTSEEITRYDNDGVMLYSRTVATEFDRAGNRVQLTLPGVTAGTPSYPGLPSMAIDYGYDYRGLLTDISADGQVIASHKYDGFGRRTDLRRKPGGNKELITSYAYETDGALSALGHVFEQAGSYSVDFEYQRNLMNQLTRVATLNEKYHHPVLNNRVVTYTPDGLNQYDEIKTDGTVETLEYDDNGSLTAQGDWSYSYDAENRLVYAENTNPVDAASVVYEYGPKGRRFAKVLTKGGATTRTEYLYDGDEPVADYLIKSGGDRLKARYINGAGVDERLALMQYSDTTGSRQSFNYYLSNHQGSIIGMMQDADGTSALTNPYSYDAYGNMRDTADGAGQPFRYTGRRFDEETGLYYYRARYYSAKLGRFLQTDPIGYEDNMNLYAYTANDPVNGKDPYGEECVNNEDGTTNCKTDDYNVTFETPEGFSGTDPNSEDFHYYTEEAQSPINAERTREWVKNKPTPGLPDAATPEGTPNDATPYVGGLLPGEGVSPVESFSTENEVTGNDVVVNVTLPDHPLFPGIVVREVTSNGDGTSTITNFGEGNGSLQKPGTWTAGPINGVWRGQKPPRPRTGRNPRR